MPTVTVIGKVQFNRLLEARTGKTHHFVGASGFFSSLAASFFCPTTLITKLGRDFPQEQLSALAQRGIDLSLVEHLPTPTVVWTARYDNLNTATTLGWENREATDDNIHVIPPAAINAGFFYLAEMDPAIQLGLLEQIKESKTLIDTKRPWARDHTAKLVEAIQHGSFLVLNEEEAGYIVGKASPEQTAARLRSFGPEIVVINLGSEGAVLATGENLFRLTKAISEKPIDTTGGGDTFCGAFIGCLAAGKSPEQAFLTASVMASFVVEDYGANRLLTLNMPQIQEREERTISRRLIEQLS